MLNVSFQSMAAPQCQRPTFGHTDINLNNPDDFERYASEQDKLRDRGAQASTYTRLKRWMQNRHLSCGNTAQAEQIEQELMLNRLRNAIKFTNDPNQQDALEEGLFGLKALFSGKQP